MTKLHIQGLDTLRGIAAMVVVIHHVEIFKGINGFDPLPFFRDDYQGAHLAVVLFFVLSGFLITVLLLNEKLKFGQISFRKFYGRRAFRIWPVYFLVLIISLLATDFNPSWITAILSFSIFPNIASYISASWTPSPQIWSIGIEEQFYFVWPLIIAKSKRIIPILIVIIIFFALLPDIAGFLNSHLLGSQPLDTIIYRYNKWDGFQCIGIGSIAAIVYFNSALTSALTRKLKRSWALVITITPFVFWAAGVNFGKFTDELYALLFSIAVFLIATKLQSFIRDTSFFKFFGKISYGIYMYHWLIMILVFNTVVPIIEDSAWFNFLLQFMVIISTVVVSTASFFLIERRLLKVKDSLFQR